MKKTIMRVLLLLAVLFAGCGIKAEENKIILTTGFEKNEVFRIGEGGCKCMLPEIMVLLVNTRNQYEETFGEEIWKADLDGVSLEENIKENVLAQISQIKTMNMLAARQKVVLEEEELNRVKEAAEAYYSSLNEREIEVMQVTPEIIEQLYAEYALADKTYRYIIKDINPEISDDEARTVTVQHIFFRTFTRDGAGEKIDYSEETKGEVYAKAKEVRMLAMEEDSDFEKLILEYSEDEKGTYSFRKEGIHPEFEEAVFNMETGEISKILETEYGYHIVKCISTFNREETDANKIKIVEARREEVFSKEYEEFIASQNKMMNDSLWEKVTLVEDEEVKTSSFFDVYEQYFGEAETQ